MATQVAVIAQKRASLQIQIHLLTTAVSEGGIDQVDAKLRLDRVRQLYYAYEDMHDELALLKVDPDGVEQMNAIYNSFYAIAAKIESKQIEEQETTNVNSSILPMGQSTFIEK